MGLIRLLLECDIVVTLFLLEELVIPFLWDRRLCPVSRWVLRRLAAQARRLSRRSPTEELLDSATIRQGEAQARPIALSMQVPGSSGAKSAPAPAKK